MILTAAIVLLFVLALGGFVARWRHLLPGLTRRAPRVPVLREVVVHTRKPDDQTLRGLADPAELRRRAPWLKLTSVRYANVDPDSNVASWEPIEGDVTIPADGVAFVQLLP